VHLEQDGSATRRRGRVLEEAILEAAWDVLSEGGYQSLTFEAVAERAHTSRSVVNRRWTTRPDLLRAAVAHYGATHASSIPDTGTLRGDVLSLLRQANRNRASMVALISAQLGTFFDETGSSPADLRAELIAGRPSAMVEIVDRAVARGEVDPTRLTERVISAPFDLFRHDMVMTLRPLRDDALVAIVDEVFLPLVRPREPTATDAGSA
jgi:AcrR family transcriptional regulator